MYIIRDLMTIELHLYVFRSIDGYTSCLRKVACQSIQGYVSLYRYSHSLCIVIDTL